MVNKKDKAKDCLNYLFNLSLIDYEIYNYIKANIMTLEDSEEKANPWVDKRIQCEEWRG